MTFNVGDQVRVTKRGVSFDENGMGVGYKWFETWEDTMDVMVGQVFTVDSYDQDRGYGFKETSYHFPENVLERVYH